MIDRNVKSRQEIEAQCAREEENRRKEVTVLVQQINMKAYIEKAKKLMEDKKMDEKREDHKAIKEAQSQFKEDRTQTCKQREKARKNAEELREQIRAQKISRIHESIEHKML